MLSSGREVSEDYRSNESSIRDSLLSLTKHTAEGVSTWGHFKSKFGSTVLSEFTEKQEQKLYWYNHELKDRTTLTTDIRTLNADHEAFSAALQTTEYRQLRNNGREGEADRLAVSMLQEHGPALAVIAPEIWKDLGMVRTTSGEAVLGTADGESVWQRLHRQNVTGSAEAPVYMLNKEGSLTAGIKELSVRRDNKDIDTELRRTIALQGIDTDPNIATLTGAANELQGVMPDLNALLQAGLEGTRGEKYVNDVRSKVKDFEQIYNRMTQKDDKGMSPVDRTREACNSFAILCPILSLLLEALCSSVLKRWKRCLRYLILSRKRG